MLGDRKKSTAATVIVCKDGRLRAFTDHGVCLGIVTPENDVETDPDGDPIGFFRGMIFTIWLSAAFLVTLYLGFKLIHWMRGYP